jgi:hypothetical protein
MKTYSFIIKRNQSSYPSGYANGYVIVDNSHSLFGKKYSDMIEVENIDDMPFNGNFIGMFITACNSERKENELSLDMAIDVHGGLTLSDYFTRLTKQDIEWLNVPKKIQNAFKHIGDSKDYWIFGFDTAHCNDDLESWPREKCIEETLKLQSILEDWK